MQKLTSPGDGVIAGPQPAATRPSRPAMLTMAALGPGAAQPGKGRPTIKRSKPFDGKPSGGAA